MFCMKIGGYNLLLKWYWAHATDMNRNALTDGHRNNHV